MRQHDPISPTVQTAVAAGVTLLVGIYVFAKIESAMPTPESAAMANTTDTVVSTAGNAFTLGAVAIIVMFASLILGLIAGQFMGGGDQPPRQQKTGPR